MAKSLPQAYLDISSRLPIDDSVKKRLDRAYEILNEYGYSIEEKKGEEIPKRYLVNKLSTSLLEDNSVTYEVSRDSCNCPDFERARGNLCKHRLAIMIREEMKREEK